jgi:hypothetical protein
MNEQADTTRAPKRRKRARASQAFKLRRYIEHCRKLIRDLDHVIEDYKFATSTDKVQYAADFSEIYNYVLPGKSHESAPFSDGWVTADEKRQYSILSQFFKRKRIILPEPYALELWGFYDQLVAGVFADEAERFAAAMTQLKAVLDDPDSKHIQNLAAVADKRDLTENEIRDAIEYFEKNASVLVAFTSGALLDPVRRVQELVRENTFVDLESVIPMPLQLDEARINQRFKEIHKRRSPETAESSSYNDAKAIEQLRAANQLLAPDKYLLLVSRSSTMATVIDEERQQDEEPWRGVRPFVRHPRIFSGAYRPADGMSQDEFIHSLVVRREELELFVRTASDALEQRPVTGTVNPPGVSKYETLYQMILKIQDKWSSGETLASAIETAPSSSGGGKQEQLARELLKFLRDDKALIDRVRMRIQEIFEETARGLGVLGARLQSADLTSPGSVLYPLRFHDSMLTQRVMALAERWTITVSEAALLFDEAAKHTTRNYDFLLAIAVSLGAIGRWSIAELYVEHALRIAESEPDLPAHEAHFFRALCLRKSLASEEPPEVNLDRLVRGIQEIALARAAAADPRYLNELAVLHGLLLDESIPDSFTFPEDVRVIDRDAVAKMLLDALKLDPLPKLGVQIRNNLAYISLHGSDDAKATMYLEQLEDFLTKTYPRTKWPSFVLDTVLYGHFRLYKGDDISIVKGWLDELRPVTQRRDMTPAELRPVVAHINAMQEAIDRAT